MDKDKCAQCGDDIDLLKLVGIHVKHGEHEFCCQTCLEEWQDAAEASIREKICPDCGSTHCMADGVTGLVCNECGASYLLVED